MASCAQQLAHLRIANVVTRSLQRRRADNRRAAEAIFEAPFYGNTVRNSSIANDAPELRVITHFPSRPNEAFPFVIHYMSPSSRTDAHLARFIHSSSPSVRAHLQPRVWVIYYTLCINQLMAPDLESVPHLCSLPHLFPLSAGSNPVQPCGGVDLLPYAFIWQPLTAETGVQ